MSGQVFTDAGELDKLPGGFVVVRGDGTKWKHKVKFDEQWWQPVGGGRAGMQSEGLLQLGPVIAAENPRGVDMVVVVREQFCETPEKVFTIHHGETAEYAIKRMYPDAVVSVDGGVFRWGGAVYLFDELPLIP